VDNNTDNGSHGNTSVLAFDGSATFERFWFSLEPSERIVDTKGGSDTDLELIHIQGSGSLSLLGRGEGGGRTSKEGGNGELHFVCRQIYEKVRKLRFVYLSMASERRCLFPRS
jgi:hypothetical protein